MQKSTKVKGVGCTTNIFGKELKYFFYSWYRLILLIGLIEFLGLICLFFMHLSVSGTDHKNEPPLLDVSFIVIINAVITLLGIPLYFANQEKSKRPNLLDYGLIMGQKTDELWERVGSLLHELQTEEGVMRKVRKNESSE